MKSKLVPICNYLLIAGAILVLCSSTRLSAQTQTAFPTAAFSLESPTSFMQGEPILLTYNLQNQSSKTFFDRVNDKWYTLSLVDEDGVLAKPRTILDSESRGGYKPVRRGYSVTPGENSTNTIVVTQYFDIPHPGKWILTATAQVPATARVTEDNVVKNVSSSVAQEFKFVLNVLPARSEHLRTVAENLRGNIAKETDSKRRLAALKALTSMPEREVWPVWEALSKDPLKAYAAQVALELGRVPSKHTADILMSMHINQAADSVPSMTLVRMDQQVDGELKTHIDSLLRQIKANGHTVALPVD
jgi:hypothetical protein